MPEFDPHDFGTGLLLFDLSKHGWGDRNISEVAGIVNAPANTAWWDCYLDGDGRFAGSMVCVGVDEDATRSLIRGDSSPPTLRGRVEATGGWLLHFSARPMFALALTRAVLRDWGHAVPGEVYYSRFQRGRRVVKAIFDKSVRPSKSTSNFTAPPPFTDAAAREERMRGQLVQFCALSRLFAVLSNESGELSLRLALQRTLPPIALKQFAEFADASGATQAVLTWAWTPIDHVDSTNPAHHLDCPLFRWNEGEVMTIIDAIGPRDVLLELGRIVFRHNRPAYVRTPSRGTQLGVAIPVENENRFCQLLVVGR